MISHKSNPHPLAIIHKSVSDCFQVYLDEGSEPDQDGIHSHPYHEILYCRSNCGAEFHLGNKRYPLQRGDVILITPDTPHAWVTRSRSAEPYMGYRLCLNPEHIANLKAFWPDFHIPEDMQYSFLRTTGTIWEPMGEMFRMLYEETHFKSTGWEVAAMSFSTYLLIQLGRAVLTNPNSQVQQERVDLVDAVLSYVQGHLGEKITLEDVAQKFWVSSSTITHLFNKQMGISFYKYVMGLRLAEAKNLISEGMPMEKVAIRVGFGDYSAFYRAFKKEFGFSPRQYLQSLAK